MLRENRMASEERVPFPSLILYLTRPKTVQSTFFLEGWKSRGMDGIRNGRSFGK